MPTMISVVATGNRMKGAEMPPFTARPRAELLSSSPPRSPSTHRLRLRGVGGVRVTHEAAVLNLVLTGDDHPLAVLQIAAEDPGPPGIVAPRFQSALMGAVSVIHREDEQAV